MPAEAVDPVSLAVERLGEPEASYRVGAGRFGAKLALGLALVAYGVAANLLAWNFGVWGVDHLKLLVLFAPPVMGLSLLRQLAVNRGLAYLVYPDGLLHVRRGEVRSVRWDEVTLLKLRADAATPVVTLDGGGRVADSRLVVSPPVVRLGNGGLTLVPAGGDPVTLTPVVAGYSELVEDVLSRTFAAEWPKVLGGLAGGGVAAFGPWAARAEGLRVESKTVPWADLHGVTVAGGQLTVRRRGGKPGKLSAPLESIPSPHVLIALIESRRSEPEA